METPHLLATLLTLSLAASSVPAARGGDPELRTRPRPLTAAPSPPPAKEPREKPLPRKPRKARPPQPAAAEATAEATAPAPRPEPVPVAVSTPSPPSAPPPAPAPDLVRAALERVRRAAPGNASVLGRWHYADHGGSGTISIVEQKPDGTFRGYYESRGFEGRVSGRVKGTVLTLVRNVKVLLIKFRGEWHGQAVQDGGRTIRLEGNSSFGGRQGRFQATPL